jgi:two-component system, chemotaxis family, CheB/CheR fusion protein
VPVPEFPPAVAPEVMAAVLDEVARRRGVDLRDYRRDTLERGLLARMRRRGETNPARYAASLTAEQGAPAEEEVARLLESLLVPCTSFFRDPPVWVALARTVLPELAWAHLERRPLRAWCVGAATGEEAWSLAMLLADLCDRPAGPDWELYATDLDQRALAVAEAGAYPAESAAGVPARLRQDHLRVEGDRVLVAPALRPRVHFSYHDLFGSRLAPREAVIAAFDVVMARNVLIYFERRLQEQALRRLAAVLQPGGALVLGPVESLPAALEDQLPWFPGLEPGLRVYQARVAAPPTPAAPVGTTR